MQFKRWVEDLYNMRRKRRTNYNGSFGMSQTPQEQATNWNTMAAAQYAQQKEQEQNQQAAEEGRQSAHHALATSLGYKPGDTIPSFERLQADYHALPDELKSEIYKRGGAQFLNGNTGAKLISGVSDGNEKNAQRLTNQLADSLLSGDIIEEKDDKGKSTFYHAEDLQKGKKKTKLTGWQLELLDRGFKSGAIPFGGEQPSSSVAPKRQTVEEFQKVLDARAMADGGPVAQLPNMGRMLSSLDEKASLKNPRGLAPATMALTPGSYFGNNGGMNPNSELLQAGVKYDPYGTFNPQAPNLKPSKPYDSAIALRQALGAAAGTGVKGFRPAIDNATRSIGDFVETSKTAIDDTKNNLLNSVPRVGNWIMRFAHGESAPQMGIPFETSASRMQQNNGSNIPATPISFNDERPRNYEPQLMNLGY